MNRRPDINRTQIAPILLGLFAVILILSACKSTRQLADQEKAGKLDIYLLIGQSNMAGRADVEKQDKDTLDGVFLYKGLEGEEWEKAANPLNKYSTIRKKLSMQKLNPGYSFAREMANSTDKQIGLVVNARGGTSINSWMPDSVYYREAVQRTREALRYGELKGMLWHQGESDASRYETYMDKIITMIQAFRQEFDNPELPVVVGQLSEDKERRIHFNEMILLLPENLSNVAVATSENTTTTDSTHFDSRSQRILGERYAREMIKLLKNQ